MEMQEDFKELLALFDKHKVEYIIVGAFALGMVLTPPDVISQTLLALPMWLLFEIGIIFSRILIKKKEEDTDPVSDQATS